MISESKIYNPKYDCDCAIETVIPVWEVVKEEVKELSCVL
jgi:hypothetical protein